MKDTLLVLDAHFLCHRAFHSLLRLSWGNEATGVVFGFLKGIRELEEEFNTDKIVFCFEGQDLKRKDIYPDYKKRRDRNAESTEDQKARADLVLQIQKLRMEYLPRIGFKNIFRYPGYESDDTMAAIAYNYPSFKVMLVTADSDMFQCLQENVSVYSPQKQKIHTVHWFKKTYKIEPREWAIVKALSGCASDNVKGIKGIGEATALKFIRRQLPSGSRAFQAIFCKEAKAIVRRNRELVKLPFEGCPVPRIVPDKISKHGWMSVCEQLGMKSIAGRPPLIL